MNYFVNLFSPDTHRAYLASDRSVSGFRESQMRAAQAVSAGDILVCYLTKLGRWFGLLEVIDGPFVGKEPIFLETDDPFTMRFHVRPLVVLDASESIPIRDPAVWSQLSFTKAHDPSTSTWTGQIRASLTSLAEDDGRFLADLLHRQADRPVEYPFDREAYEKLTVFRVRRTDRDVSVSVPEDDPDETLPAAETSGVRESHRMQALLADLGAQLGMDVWIPKSDRNAVLGETKFAHDRLIDRLPMNYDDTTLKTIENIDVLWLHGRSIARAFEVEQTTAVYSGILRMADLLALQPNMDIKLHLVAPSSRRGLVFDQLRRPVFSLLDRGPLAEICTFLSYDSLAEVASLPNLLHMRDSVLDAYLEEPQDTPVL
jgi:hypothetical protein